VTETKQRPSTTVTIEVELIELTHREVLPDWDGEQELTADLVAELIRKDGGLGQVIRDWCLLDRARITVETVEPNPFYGGDAVLFGSAPPPVRRAITEAEVHV
jgi:hypothetical protein